MNDKIVPEHKPRFDREDWILILCIVLIPLIFLIGASWYAFGFGVTFIAILVLLGIAGGWLFFRHIHLHFHHTSHLKLERKEREHAMEIAKEALRRDHSVQLEYPSGHKIQTVSPFTIPNGPVTVKELNMGSEPPPQLVPPIMQPSMDDMYNAVRYNSLDVAFGKDAENGEIVIQNIPGGVHFKLVGASGFGKSCLAGALLDIATKRNDPDHLRIALLDLEYKTSRLFEHLPHIFEMSLGTRRIRMHAKDADSVARHLAYLRKELDRRATRQVNTPLLLIYVEEMLSLQYEVDTRLKEQMLADLAILALRGRKYGMFLLACTQTDYSTKELREAQKMFRTRSGFAIDPSAARAAGFVNNDLVKYNFQNAKPGRYLFERPALSRLVLAPLYDVEQKLEEMSNPSRVYVPGNQWVEGTSWSPPGQFPMTDELEYGNQGGRQAEVDENTLDLVRKMAVQQKGVNEIASAAFPGMRNVDAIAEVRRYIAFLISDE